MYKQILRSVKHKQHALPLKQPLCLWERRTFIKTGVWLRHGNTLCLFVMAKPSHIITEAN